MSQSSGTSTGPVRTTAFPHTSAAREGNGAGAASAPPSHPPAGGQSSAAPQPSGLNGASRPSAASGSSRPSSSKGAGAASDNRQARPAGRGTGPRRVRLAASRVDPWSVMKLAFLMSIAIGIGIVVATAVLWWVLNQMGVFAEVRGLLEEAEALAQFGLILEYLEFSRVMSVATVIAIVDVLLLTALATLGAFIYNIVAAMVGGIHLTLTDD